MSTAFFRYDGLRQGGIVGIRQMRAHKQKAFVWAVPPHEFLAIADAQTPIRDEYGVVYPFPVFVDDVVKPCAIHELDTRLLEDDALENDAEDPTDMTKLDAYEDGIKYALENATNDA